MIILETENERKVLQCLFNYIYETHTCYWSTDGHIDYDKEEYNNLAELRDHIRIHLGKDFFDDGNFDMCKFLTTLNGGF